MNTLTVEENLMYYARIKGIPAYLRQKIVEEAIEELNLHNHRLKLAETLSGGNKRKLSVGLALMGNPPIILLDEPSAGMDPKARRFLWTVISNKTRNSDSLVVLTTHSMEEAEALSSKNLKNKFGKGFEVEIRIKTGEKNRHE